MDTIGKRITEARKAKGLSTQQVANALGISYQAARQWESDKNLPRQDKVATLAKLLGVSLVWLQFGPETESHSGPPAILGRGNIRTPPRRIKVFDNNDPVGEDEVLVKRLTLKVSAGSGNLQWEIEENGVPNRYRRSWVEKHGFNPDKLVTIQIDGDSMSPRLENGGSVTIDTSDTRPRSGKIYAIDYRGEFFIKRLFVEPDGSIRLTSDNPDRIRYPDWTIRLEHADALRILGRAVQTSNDL